MVLSEQDMQQKMRQGGSTFRGLDRNRPPLSDRPLAANPGGGSLQGGGPMIDQPPYSGPALSAPPTGEPNRATPASGDQPSGGAGNPQTTPTDMLNKADPESVIKDAETAAKAAAKSGATDDPQADKQKKELNAAMAAQNMDPVASFTQLKDEYIKALDQRHEAGEIDKKQHSGLKERWKNIFNIVPEEDMGLFMMDFGLRLAAHSASTSFGGAVGQAGVEALGGVQGRKAAAQESALQRDEIAHRRALDMAGLGHKEREVASGEKMAQAALNRSEADRQPVPSSGGFMERQEDGTWKYVTINGEIPKPFSAAGMDYRGEKAWLYDMFRAAHPEESEAQIMARVTAGASAEGIEDRETFFRESLKELMGTFNQDTNGKRYRDYTTAEQEAYVKERLHMQDQTRNEYRSEAANRQQPPPPATVAPGALTPGQGQPRPGDNYLSGNN